MREEKRRNTGIPVLGDVPWGTHFCLFYHTKGDLIDILVPYFKAGLENNEFCMWVTSPPLVAQDAKRSLARLVPNLDDSIEKGQMEILDYSQWYTKSGIFEADKVLQGWIEKESQAVARGFDGLRLSGNTLWLEKGDWKAFTEYEAMIHRTIGKYRMVALCTYSLDKCGAPEVLDVMANHQFALIRREGKWETVRSTETKRAEKALSDSEARYWRLFEAAQDGILILDAATGQIIDANPFLQHLLGYTHAELLGKTLMEIGLFKDIAAATAAFQQLQSEGYIRYENLPLGTKEGEPRQVEFVSNAYLSDGMEVIQCSIRDITERKRAEEEIRSLAKFPSENPNPILRVDRNGTVLYANAACAPLLHLWRSGVGSALPGDYRPLIMEALRTGVLREIEVSCDGKLFSLILVPVAENNYVNLYGRDITERKRAEEVLRESEARFRSYFELPLIGIAITSPEKGWIEVNGQICSMMGYSREELLRMTWSELTHPEDLAADVEQFNRILAGQIDSYSMDKRFIRKNGEVVWTSIAVGCVRDSGRRVKHIVALGLDITERKRAEEALRESEERFRRAVLEAPFPIILHADDGEVIQINHVWSELTGYAHAEIPTIEDWKERAYGERKEAVRADIDRLYGLDRRLAEGEYVIRTKAGDSRTWDFASVPIGRLPDGRRMVMGMATDITDRKRAEAALRQSESRYRSLFENMLNGFAYCKMLFAENQPQDFVCLDVNRAFGDLTGLANVVGKKVTEVIPGIRESNRELFEICGRVALTGVPEKFETYIESLGNWFSISVFSSQREYFVTAFENITDRKRAEAALRESEKQFKTSVENMLDCFGIYSAVRDPSGLIVDFRIDYVNEAACRANLMTRGEQIGKLLCELLPAHRETGLFDAYCRIVETGEPLTMESVSYEDVFGEQPRRRVFSIRGSKLGDGFAASWRDITERKRAEQALRESEEGLRLALEAAHMGTFDWDIVRIHITWSRGHEVLFGFAPGAFGGTYEAFEQRVHPADLPGINAEVARCIAARAPFAREFRVVWPDGSVHWVAGQGEFTFGDDGQAVRMRGVALETTARKQAEEELRASREQLRALAARMAEVGEAERRRLSQELHDRVGQSLTALGISLSVAQGEVAAGAAAQAEARLEDALGLLGEAVERTRDVMGDLRPHVLDDYGLAAALRWHGERFAERAGVAVLLEGDDPFPRLPAPVETALFRIAQEALTNIAKHARARRVTLTLETAEGTSRLIIADDGAGFDPQAPHPPGGPQGWGLLSMRERAEAVGGTLTVEAAPGQGTRVTVTVW